MSVSGGRESLGEIHTRKICIDINFTGRRSWFRAQAVKPCFSEQGLPRKSGQDERRKTLNQSRGNERTCDTREQPRRAPKRRGHTTAKSGQAKRKNKQPAAPRQSRDQEDSADKSSQNERHTDASMMKNFSIFGK